VPLIPGVEAALRRQQERQDWAAVYPSEWRAGKRASYDVIRKHLRRLAAAVGVRVLSPHAGRHAVGNLLGAAGIPLATIATRLRHRSPKTTADWYLESESVGEEAASALLETLFNGKASGE
jgi:integrase